MLATNVCLRVTPYMQQLLLLLCVSNALEAVKNVHCLKLHVKNVKTTIFYTQPYKFAWTFVLMAIMENKALLGHANLVLKLTVLYAISFLAFSASQITSWMSKIKLAKHLQLAYHKFRHLLMVTSVRNVILHATPAKVLYQQNVQNA